jgi:3-deoxy-manno-octulosonate cytidylyltransferase (CMP-KDO synthetase)
MKTIGIIPARFGSTRFPGKPLADIFGIPMVIRVYKNAMKANRLNRVIIATDDERIYSTAQHWGADVMMTNQNHLSGTDRCAEVASLLDDFDYYLNIQGDEPFVNHTQFDDFIHFTQNHSPEIASLKTPISDLKNISNPSVVKVVTDNFDNALYFSRSPIPHDTKGIANYFKHLGVYIFKKETLMEIAKLPIGNLEKIESLEQLRWIENGYKIKLMTTNEESYAVDTPEDLQLIKNIYHDKVL